MILIQKNQEAPKTIENPFPELNENEPIYITQDDGETWTMHDITHKGEPYDDTVDNQNRPWDAGEQVRICERLQEEGTITTEHTVRFSNGREYLFGKDGWTEDWSVGYKLI